MQLDDLYAPLQPTRGAQDAKAPHACVQVSLLFDAGMLADGPRPVCRFRTKGDLDLA